MPPVARCQTKSEVHLFTQRLAAAQNSCIVAAASDLTYAKKEIAADFEKSAGCSVRVSYGSDQKVKRPPSVGATLLL
jgi:ABC-type molybdate transport system substrate-binding protein